MLSQSVKIGETFSPNPRWLLFVTVLLSAVFFYVAHDFSVSRHESYAPWSENGGSLESGKNVTKGLAIGMIGLVGCYFLVRKEGRRLQFRGLLPAIMLFYVIWSAASVLWSIDPAMSCRKLTAFFCCFLGAIGIARQFRPRDLAVMAAGIMASYLIVGAATELALGTFRPWVANYRFSGTVHPNTQGSQMAVLCLALFCLARSAEKGRKWLWLLFAVAMIFLVLTKSRTSLSAAMLAMFLLWFLEASGGARFRVAVFAGCAVFALLLLGAVFDFGGKYADMAMLGRQEEHEDSESLNGRTPLWAMLLDYVRKKPLLGYGYQAFWTVKHIDFVTDELQWPLREAHNAYIESALSVGLIGTLSLLAAFALTLWRAAPNRRRTANRDFSFTFTMLIFISIGTYTESSAIVPYITTLLIGCGASMAAFIRPENNSACENSVGMQSAATLARFRDVGMHGLMPD